MEEYDLLHPSFEHLTQLTSLSLTDKCAGFCFEPVNLLTQLEEVWLEADDKESSSIFGETEGPPMDLAPLCRLTDLGLDGWTGWEVSARMLKLNGSHAVAEPDFWCSLIFFMTPGTCNDCRNKMLLLGQTSRRWITALASFCPPNTE